MILGNFVEISRDSGYVTSKVPRNFAGLAGNPGPGEVREVFHRIFQKTLKSENSLFKIIQKKERQQKI